MKQTLLIIVSVIFYNSIAASEINLETKAYKATIYHSGALISRIINTKLKQGVHELTFNSLSSKIILNSLKFNNKEVTILNKTIIKKLSKEEYNQLLDKKDVLKNQLTLLEAKYNEPTFLTKVDDLEKMIKYYSYKILKIKKTLREVEKEIVEAKKIEAVNLGDKNAAILKITVSIAKEISKPLDFQYVVGGIGWSPSYEITVKNASSKTIEVKYLARIMSQTGENWDNIQISLSSSFPLESPTTLPKPTDAWTLNGNSDFNQPYSNTTQNEKEQLQQIDKLEGVKYTEINMPSFLELRKLNKLYSIKSNSTVFSFPITKVNLPATFHYYGFPSLDPESYLVSQINDWDTLGFVDGMANITFNGNDIGKTIIKYSEYKDTLLLPIGKDNSIFLKRNEIANQKYFNTTRNSKKRKSTLAYEYIVKNNNSFPIKYQLVDQIPISQTKSAKVTLENYSNGKIDYETGEVSWIKTLNPGETIQQELIYAIEMNSNYKYYGSRKSTKKYRTIACPSF